MTRIKLSSSVIARAVLDALLKQPNLGNDVDGLREKVDELLTKTVTDPSLGT